MALVPNVFTDTVLDIPVKTDDFTETMGSMAISTGSYQSKGGAGGNTSKSQQQDSVIIEQTKTILNQYGTKIREDQEDWVYEIFKGPPLEFNRTTSASVYLPGLGRQFRKVEEEQIIYWTFTPLANGDNLGRTRFLSAYVIYDLPVDPEKPTTPEASEKLEDKGVKPGPTEDRIISTGKIWSEANSNSRIVEDESANQVTKWVENVIIEHDIVEEEVDKWTIWTIKKNALRPGDVKVDGPRHIKKTGFTYRFPVDLNPPELKAQSTAAGVLLTVTGGGATYNNKYYGKPIYIVPDKYNIYRATIAEPPRDESGDKEDWYDPDPPAKAKPKIIGTSATTDQGGTPADPLPPSSGHTDPGDVTEPEEPTEVAFSMIGTVDNDFERRWRDEGHATFKDLDVETAGQYEYYAEAIVNDQVSPESNHVLVTYTGGKYRNHRLGYRTNDDGSIEIDAEAPDDPSVPPSDYGEVIDFEVPAAVDEDDAEDLTDDIATRQFAANEPDFTVNLDVLMPILGLEYCQSVQMPQILWETYGNQLIMSQGTLPEKWTLNGFSMNFDRASDGNWSSQRTTLKLRKRNSR